jgi:hypothetical protein
MLRLAAACLVLSVTTAHAEDANVASVAKQPWLVAIEADPFPFATLRYGVQVGVRPPALRGLRIALANFSLDVPDVISQLGGNDGFHTDVRPGSGALYALYFLKAPGLDGFCVGASVRYLRWRYTHDDFPGERTNVTQISPEAIVGYQWHPFKNGFYLQPWLALGVVASRSADPIVGTREYDEMPISTFFTVNVGYERKL